MSMILTKAPDVTGREIMALHPDTQQALQGMIEGDLGRLIESGMYADTEDYFYNGRCQTVTLAQTEYIELQLNQGFTIRIERSKRGA